MARKYPTLEEYCDSAVSFISQARAEDTEWRQAITELEEALEDINRAISIATQAAELDES